MKKKKKKRNYVRKTVRNNVRRKKGILKKEIKVSRRSIFQEDYRWAS